MVGPDQPVTAGPYEITFDGFAIDQLAMMEGGMAEIGARLKVVYEGEESTVIPAMRLVPDQTTKDESLQEVPAVLPGGHEVSLVNFSPEMRLVFLDIKGLDLPIQTERAVISVSTKPLVLLVWVGVIVSVIGGGIATLRRYFEGQARLVGQAARLPRGLSGLAGRFGWRGAGR